MKRVVTKGYCGNESIGLSWDHMKVSPKLKDSHFLDLNSPGLTLGIFLLLQIHLRLKIHKILLYLKIASVFIYYFLIIVIIHGLRLAS